MRKLQFLKGVTRIITDFLSGFLAWYFAYYIRPWTDLIPNVKFLFPIENLPNPEFFLLFTTLSSFGLVFIFSLHNLYKYPAKYINFSIVGKIFWGIFFWVLSTVAIYSLILHQHIFSRIMLAHSAIFTFVFSIAFRFILRILFQKIFKGKKSVLLIGNPKETLKLEKILKNSEYTKFQHCIPENFSPTYFEKTFLGDDIFLFEINTPIDVIHKVRNFSALKGKILHSIPAYFSEFWGHSRFDIIRGYPVIISSPYRENIWWRFFKRVFDIIFSFFFIIFFSPIFLLVSIFIKIDAKDWKSPVFYISKRVGKNGKVFKMWKFRSMVIDADKNKKQLEQISHRDGPLFKVKNDPRITKIGKFLRKTSIDEIPQFINVLKGEMSIIGPRPHLPSEIEKYSDEQKRILACKPGISGLAQVSGRSDLSFEDEIFLDSYYMENFNFFLDFKIFLKTPFVLLFGKGND